MTMDYFLVLCSVLLYPVVYAVEGKTFFRCVCLCCTEVCAYERSSVCVPFISLLRLVCRFSAPMFTGVKPDALHADERNSSFTHKLRHPVSF
ncbi:unnamed protein product [Boreogadus saida]